MSKIYDPAVEADAIELFAILKVNPELKMEISLKGSGDWAKRVSNKRTDGELKGFDMVFFYRIKEDQS